MQKESDNHSKKTKRELELEAKVAALEKKLQHEQLRVEALNTLIDVAEEQLKIDIRKKRGTKQQDGFVQHINAFSQMFCVDCLAGQDKPIINDLITNTKRFYYRW